MKHHYNIRSRMKAQRRLMRRRNYGRTLKAVLTIALFLQITAYNAKAIGIGGVSGYAVKHTIEDYVTEPPWLRAKLLGSRSDPTGTLPTETPSDSIEQEAVAGEPTPSVEETGAGRDSLNVPDGTIAETGHVEDADSSVAPVSTAEKGIRKKGIKKPEATEPIASQSDSSAAETNESGKDSHKNGDDGPNFWTIGTLILALVQTVDTFRSRRYATKTFKEQKPSQKEHLG